MRKSPYRIRFDVLMLPHMGAAYNLARWITKNPDDAADVVQESYARALRFFDDCRGENPRAWLLAIVRNASLNWLEKVKNQRTVSWFELGGEEGDVAREIADETIDIEFDIIQKQAAVTLDNLIAALPVSYREVIVLREIEELSYKEIATVIGLPVGTVMSRLSRGRQLIQKYWKQLPENRESNEMR